jgi:predicted DNA-binding transcriptional regulator AlpA
MKTTRYLTTADYAASTGLSASTIRRLAAAGDIPGAVRISGRTGAWRFPDPDQNDSTPPSEAGRGVSAEAPGGSEAIMSPSGAGLLDVALRVSDHLALVAGARPARALRKALMVTVAAGLRHYADRDGWCVACRWQSPCADELAAHRVVTETAAIVLDGAA